jgi:hypothetical protein
MPKGERSQVWYPELVDALRAAWRPDLTWDSIVRLRDQLQVIIDDLRHRRGIEPPTILCRNCGHRGPAAQPTITVRAMLISVGRFGIEPLETARKRERDWARHRVLHDLNLIGRPQSILNPDHSHPRETRRT